MERQAIILVAIITLIAVVVFAVVEQHLELKKLQKKRNSAMIKRKWLECAYKYEM